MTIPAPSIRVAISRRGVFRLSDEAILLCVERGMTMAPPPAEDETRIDPSYDFFEWSERHRSIVDQQYGTRCGGHDNEFRANPIVLGVLEELGDRAMECDIVGQRPEFAIIEIPFASTDGWHIRDEECGTGEYVCEDHRTWSYPEES